MFSSSVMVMMSLVGWLKFGKVAHVLVFGRPILWPVPWWGFAMRSVLFGEFGIFPAGVPIPCLAAVLLVVVVTACLVTLVLTRLSGVSAGSLVLIAFLVRSWRMLFWMVSSFNVGKSTVSSWVGSGVALRGRGFSLGAFESRGSVV